MAASMESALIGIRPRWAAKKTPAKKASPAQKVVAKSANLPAVKNVAVAGQVGGATVPAQAPASSPTASPSTVPADLRRKISENLRKMGDNRPVKAASLRRALKSLLGAEAGDESKRGPEWIGRAPALRGRAVALRVEPSVIAVDLPLTGSHASQHDEDGGPGLLTALKAS